MQNDRVLLIGGVDLVRGRLRGAGQIMAEICDELEPVLRSTGYPDSAPFRTVSLILRFGRKRDLVPAYRTLDGKHSELPVSVELEMAALSRMPREQLKREFMIATLSVLVDVGRRYGLPHARLADQLLLFASLK